MFSVWVDDGDYSSASPRFYIKKPSQITFVSEFQSTPIFTELDAWDCLNLAIICHVLLSEKFCGTSIKNLILITTFFLDITWSEDLKVFVHCPPISVFV